MYGPPGCGKSLIAKATANEADASFFHVKSSDLRSKYFGETEKNIAALFKKAREQQPAIIFFDEFEVLGADRTNAHSHEKSAVAQFLTEIDGMDSKDQKTFTDYHDVLGRAQDELRDLGSEFVHKLTNASMKKLVE